MLRLGRLRLSWSLFALLFFLLLFEREDLLAVVGLPILVHELGHLLFLRLNGRSASSLTLSAAGARLIPAGEEPGFVGSLLEILGGCLFSLTFAFLFSLLGARWGNTWLLACGGTSLVLGAFNLLPCVGLDGGRAVETLFDRWTGRGDAAVCITSCAVTVLLLLFGLARVLRGHGVLPLMAGSWCLFRLLKWGRTP